MSLAGQISIYATYEHTRINHTTMRVGAVAAAPKHVRDALDAAVYGGISASSAGGIGASAAGNAGGYGVNSHGLVNGTYVEVYIGNDVVVWDRVRGTVTTYPRGYPLVNFTHIKLPRAVSRDQVRLGDTASQFRVSAVTAGMSKRAIADLFHRDCSVIARRGFGIWDQHSPRSQFIDFTGILPRMHLLGPRVVMNACSRVLLYRRRGVHTRRRLWNLRTLTVVHWNTCTRTCIRLRIRGMVQERHDNPITNADYHTIVSLYGDVVGFDDCGRWVYVHPTQR